MTGARGRWGTGRSMGLVALVVALGTTGCSSLSQSVALKDAPADARPGGVLRVAIGPPDSLDPAYAYTSSAQLVLSVVCEPLLSADVEHGNLVGALARTMINTSGGLAVSMNLNGDVEFHDGRQLSAKDVKYALSRLARQDVASFFGGSMSSVAGFQETTKNLEAEDEDAQAAARELSGISTSAGTTVIVGLTGQRADWARVLSQPFAAVVPDEIADRDQAAFERQPICAGPYRLAEPWGPSDPVIRVDRFDDYYGKNQAYTQGGAGYADAIEFHVYPSPEQAYAAFRRGEADVVEVPPESLAQARAELPESLVTAPTGQVEYVGLPTNLPPFDVEQVRVAMSRALDRETIVDQIYDGGRLPATGFVPPVATDVYREAACTNVPKKGRFSRPVSGAQTAVAGAFVLQYNDEFRNRELVEALAAQWREKLGLNFQTQAVDWDLYTRQATSGGGFEGAFRLTWEPLAPSAQEHLIPLFHSGAVGVTNWSRYSDVAFDKLAQVPPQQDDMKDRVIGWHLTEDRLCETIPMIPVTFGQAEYLVDRERVHTAVGSYTDVASGRLALREMYLVGG